MYRCNTSFGYIATEISVFSYHLYTAVIHQLGTEISVPLNHFGTEISVSLHHLVLKFPYIPLHHLSIEISVPLHHMGAEISVPLEYSCYASYGCIY